MLYYEVYINYETMFTRRLQDVNAVKMFVDRPFHLNSTGRISTKPGREQTTAVHSSLGEVSVKW